MPTAIPALQLFFRSPSSDCTLAGLGEWEGEPVSAWRLCLHPIELSTSLLPFFCIPSRTGSPKSGEWPWMSDPMCTQDDQAMGMEHRSWGGCQI